jgi:hypothetical protein
MHRLSCDTLDANLACGQIRLLTGRWFLDCAEADEGFAEADILVATIFRRIGRNALFDILCL